MSTDELERLTSGLPKHKNITGIQRTLTALGASVSLKHNNCTYPLNLTQFVSNFPLSIFGFVNHETNPVRAFKSKHRFGNNPYYAWTDVTHWVLL